MNRTVQVRFHLGRGLHYRQWQVRQGSKVQYVFPSKQCLFMLDCKLVNRKREAAKIFAGGHKTVCAWVACRRVLVVDNLEDVPNTIVSHVAYDPRSLPYWHNGFGFNLDGHTFTSIVSVQRKLYICTINTNLGDILDVHHLAGSST